MLKKFQRPISFLIALLLCINILPVGAQQTEKQIRVFFKDIRLFVEDEPLSLFDAAGSYVEPFIYNDTTYLPLRAVAEALHMQVDWDQSAYSVYLSAAAQAAAPKTGTVTKSAEPEKDILVTYHDIAVYADGSRLTLLSAAKEPVEPFLYNDTVYLPLRSVAEATSSKVDWNAETNSIHISPAQEDLQTEPKYDIAADSDWTADEASAYGYTVDFDAYADKGYACITKYAGAAQDILVPAKIDGKITCINGDIKPFNGNETISSVTFENGVTALSVTNLFFKCTSLKYVYNLPNNGTGSTNCFYGCSSLLYTDNLPATSGTATSTFYLCGNLRSAPVIPKSVSKTTGAFSGCAQLEGDIYCLSAEISQAENMFANTQKQINLHVPYPSTSYTTFENADFPENVTLIKTQNQIAFLPKEIYVSTYTTLPIYNYAVAPGFSDYTFQWECDIATPTDTGINLKGDETQLGAYPLTLTILDKGNEVAKLTSTVKLISAKLKKPMRLVTIGDSTAYSSAAWMRRVNALSESISFVGSRQGKHEGRMGYSSDKYLEQFNYTSDKNGLNELNPFYNPETNQFDWNYYKSYTSISPTAVQFLFGSTNAAADQTANINNIKTMVDAIQQADPKIQIFIAYIPYVKSGNAARDKAAFNFMIETEKAFSGYENVHFIPLSLTYNRDINYNEKNKAVPNEAGYEQFGTCIFAALAGQLQ